MKYTCVGELYPQIIVPKVCMGVKMDDMDIRVLFCHSTERA